MNLKNIFSNVFKKEVGWNSAFSLSPQTATKTNQQLYFGIIFSCIDAIATTVSEVPYGLFKKAGEDWEEIVSHPILDLINKPNALQTGTDFIYLMSTHIDTNGQSLIYPVKSKIREKRVVEMQLLNPNGIRTLVKQNSPLTEVIGYKYVKGTNSYAFNPEEIINVLKPNPFSQASGISTIQMSRFDGTNELNSIQMNNAFYDNGATPSGILETEQTMDPATFNKLKAKIKAQYEGKSNAFRMMFLTHGLSYKAVSPTQRDMQYVEQRKLNRDQILSIFKVPKSIIAVSDSVNRATAYAENISFQKVVIKPRLELIYDKLNRFLLPLFDLDPNEYQLRFENPVTEDQEFILKEKVASVNVWRTVNEVRQDEGLDPIEGGDELPLTNLLSTQSDEQSATPDSDKDDSKKDDEEKGLKHEHILKEMPANPDDVKGKKNKEYVKRRNAYFQYKESQYSLALLQHFNFLIRDIKKSPIKKELETDDTAEKFEYTDEQVFEKIMPEKEKRKQWEMLLLLLLLQNNVQIWKTNTKQLNEIYNLDVEMDDLTENFISRRAVFTAKSVSDTVYKNIKNVINKNVVAGVTDLGQIKKDIAFLLTDAKSWKVEQIARTELSWAYGEASYRTYQDNGIEKVQWLCGSNPCETCQLNCGQVIEINKLFASGHIHEPVHPSCRCTVLPVV